MAVRYTSVRAAQLAAARAVAPATAPVVDLANRRRGAGLSQSSPQPLPEASELQVHMAVVGHLRLLAPRDVVWWHTPNEGQRSKAEAAKLQAMGLKAGIPDLVIIHMGRTFGLEIKTTRGRVSAAQRAMLAAFERAGAFTGVGYGLDATLEILTAWGILPASTTPAKLAA